MSILLALATSGGGAALTTVTYTASQTVTLPGTVANLVLVSGDGADGSKGTSTTVHQYSQHKTETIQRNDLGGQTTVYDGGTVTKPGTAPADYCNPITSFQTNGVTSYDQICYTFTDTSYVSSTADKTGASATGFGLTFPGGVAKPATTTTFNNVAVTPGGTYNLVVPAGGSITISYYA